MMKYTKSLAWKSAPKANNSCIKFKETEVFIAQCKSEFFN